MKDIKQFFNYFDKESLSEKDKIIFFYLNRKIFYSFIIISFLIISFNHIFQPEKFEAKCVILSNTADNKKNSITNPFGDISTLQNNDLQNIYNIDFFNTLLKNKPFLINLLQNKINYKNKLISIDDYYSFFAINNSLENIKYETFEIKRKKTTNIEFESNISNLKNCLSMNKNDNQYIVSVITDNPLVSKQILQILVNELVTTTVNYRKKIEKDKLDKFQNRINEHTEFVNESIKKLSKFKDSIFNVNIESKKSKLLILQNDYSLKQATLNSLINQYDQYNVTTKNILDLFTIIDPITDAEPKHGPNFLTQLLLSFIISAIIYILIVILASYILYFIKLFKNLQ
jgi:hypothetical protein